MSKRTTPIDIVDRLRDAKCMFCDGSGINPMVPSHLPPEPCFDCRGETKDPLCADAADEIERLREERDAAKAEAEACRMAEHQRENAALPVGEGYRAVNDALRAQNEQLLTRVDLLRRSLDARDRQYVQDAEWKKRALSSEFEIERLRGLLERWLGLAPTSYKGDISIVDDTRQALGEGAAKPWKPSGCPEDSMEES